MTGYKDPAFYGPLEVMLTALVRATLAGNSVSSDRKQLLEGNTPVTGDGTELPAIGVGK